MSFKQYYIESVEIDDIINEEFASFDNQIEEILSEAQPYKGGTPFDKNKNINPNPTVKKTSSQTFNKLKQNAQQQNAQQQNAQQQNAQQQKRKGLLDALAQFKDSPFNKEYRAFSALYSQTQNAEDVRDVFNSYLKHIKGVRERSTGGNADDDTTQKDYKTLLRALKISTPQEYNEEIQRLQMAANNQDMDMLKKIIKKRADTLTRFKQGIDRHMDQRKSWIQKQLTSAPTLKKAAIGGIKGVGDKIDKGISNVASGSNRSDAQNPLTLLAKGAKARIDAYKKQKYKKQFGKDFSKELYKKQAFKTLLGK